MSATSRKGDFSSENSGMQGLPESKSSALKNPGVASRDDDSRHQDPSRSSWRHLTYAFCQTTTFHGLRYMTAHTHYQTRRVTWFLVVAIAAANFAYLNVLNFETYTSYPKSVNLELTYRDGLSFPAVTICNHNTMRLSALAHIGLYDKFWEYYNNYGQSTDGSCIDVFSYIPELCVENVATLTAFTGNHSWDGFPKNVFYKDISELACESLCSNLHDDTCGAVFYDSRAVTEDVLLIYTARLGYGLTVWGCVQPRVIWIGHKEVNIMWSERTCIITSLLFSSWMSEFFNACAGEYLQYFRRIRCPVLGAMLCDFEVDRDCLLRNISQKTDEMWAPITSAELGAPFNDHSMGYQTGLGHYMHMLETDQRQGFMAAVQSPFLLLNSSCLELFYYFMGDTVTTLSVQVLTEDFRVISTAIMTSSTMTNGHWNRLFVQLPNGILKVKVIGQRPKAPGTSGVAVDDLSIQACPEYYTDCKRNTVGTEYLGPRHTTVSGAECAPWSTVLASGSTQLQPQQFPDHRIEDAQNFCRNPNSRGPSPWCYLDVTGRVFEPCDVPFCECAEGSFQCQSGPCIPETYLCNGVDECGDFSDEMADNCPDNVNIMGPCDFEDAYSCGFHDGSASQIYWTRTRSLDVADTQAPMWDAEGAVLGHYLIASAVRGVEGDVASVLSQVLTIPTDQYCLSMDLYLVFSRPSSENALTILMWKAGFYPQILYRIEEWTHDTWRRLNLRLEPGRYVVAYAFTMGFAYQCDAALDNIYIGPCPRDGVTENLVQEDYSPHSASANCTFLGGNTCNYTVMSTNSRSQWKLFPTEFTKAYTLNQGLLEDDEGDLGVEYDEAGCRMYHSSTGQFDSPFYPTNYTNYLDQCLGRILGPPSSSVTIWFHSFDVEPAILCMFDKVLIMEGAITRHKLCNYQIDLSARYVLGNDVHVWIVTDVSIIAAGFRLFYEISSPPNEDYMMYLEHDGSLSNTLYRSILFSPVVNISEPSCLTVKYMAAGEVTVELMGDNRRTIFTDDQSSRIWNLVRIDIEPGYYSIAVTGSFFGDERGFKVVLDDILVQPYACGDSERDTPPGGLPTIDPDPGHVVSVSCDFSDMRQCGYRDRSPTPSRWTRRHWSDAGNPSAGLSYYMGCTFSLEQLDTRILSSPVVTIETASCLSFSYIAPAGISEIQLTLAGGGLILGSPRSSDVWDVAQANLPNGTYTVNFIAQGRGVTIGLSNVSVHGGACDDQSPTQFLQKNDHGTIPNDDTTTPANLSQPVVPPQDDAYQPLLMETDVRRPTTAGERSLYDVMLLAGHTFDDFITSCQWMGDPCTSDMIVPTVTELGLCYTFNPVTNGSTALKTTRQGSKYGLKLVLNIEQYDHTRAATPDAGIKAHLHSQGDIPNVKNLGTSAGLSTHTSMAVRYVKSESLPPPYGGCGAAPLQLYTNETYTRARCLQECQALDLQKRCGCIMYYMPEGSYRDCGCVDACDMVSFSHELSHSSLSRLGVDQLLASDLDLLTSHYHDVLELQERMIPSKVLRTVTTMKAILQNMGAMISFARERTALGPTSEYDIVRNSINDFADIINTDIGHTFNDVSQYTKAFDIIFRRQHLSNMELIRQTMYHVSFLAQHVDFYTNNIDHNLDHSLDESRLRESVVKVDRHLHLLRHVNGYSISQPIVDVIGDEYHDFVPTSIYPNRYFAYTCDAKIFFDFPLFQDDIPSLKNFSDVLSVAQSVPYIDILRMLHGNLTWYQDCSSVYSSFLHTLTTWTDTYELPHIDAITHGFVFEHVAADFLGDFNWLKSSIFSRYMRGEITMMELADTVTTEKISLLTQHMDTFRLSIRDQFSKHLHADLEEHRASYQRLYTEMLEFILNFEMHFVSHDNRFWDLARDQNLWRIPEAHIQAGNPVQFRNPKQEVWRIWPEYMNTQAFYSEQLANVFNEIDLHLFDVLSSVITHVDEQMVQFSTSIKNDLSAFLGHMETFKSTTNVDSSFILRNILAFDVYYGELIYELIEQQPSYTMNDAFSDLGSYMGLFIGASVLSICEILDLILYNAFLKCCGLQKR